MTDIRCIYPDREAVLVAYLYDDIDAAGRVAFETHVTTCFPCRSELAGMRNVRSTLTQWVAPESSGAFTFEPRAASPEPRAWWHDVPVWAQVAAAMLVLGVSASIANLDVRYDKSGLNVRTGWSMTPATVAAPAPAPAPAQAQTVDNAASRDDLAALRTELQSQIRAQSASVRAASFTAGPASGTAISISDADFQRRVRALLDESEQNQKRELAMRLVQLQRDFNTLLQNERGQTNQLFRNVTDSYGSQIQSQQKQINYLLPAGR